MEDIDMNGLFEEIQYNYELARKKNRQTKILSVLSLVLSVIALIIRILMAQ